MPLPDYQSLMLPVLKTAAQGEIRLRNATELLAEEFQLSEAEKAEMLPSGQQTIFANRVGWAKTYLKKAGLVETTRRGYFQITERGREILEKAPNTIDKKFLEQFKEFNQFRNRKTKKEEELEPATSNAKTYTPDEAMRTAHQQIQENLAQELLEHVINAPPNYFERLIITLLIRMGYGGSGIDTGRALGQSHDSSVDGVIDQDALGLDQVYIQAKRYATGNNIGSREVREFSGSLNLYQANKGVFATTSAFSKEAQETASALDRRIILIDGKYLAYLMIRYNVGCRVEETFCLKKVDEDFFE
jgi:restriction system protein